MAKTLDFSLRLKANNEDLKRKVNEAVEELNRLYTQLNAGAFPTMQTEKWNRQLEAIPSRLNPIADGVRNIGRSFVGWAVGIASIAAVEQGIKSVLAATMQMDAVRTRFEYAFGGAEEAGKQLEFVRETANRLGLEFTSTASGYSQLASATKDLNITNEQTQQIFTGVASAAATMGLSADETSGVILALSQIAGKGKVSMEELRGQLGERLTPAMSIAAKAMGVTSAELEKMVESGLSAEVFLPKFGAALEEAFGGKAKENVKSLSGQINLLKNQLTELQVELGNSGLAAAATDVVAKLGESIQWLREQMASVEATGLKQAFAEMADTLQTAFSALSETLGDVFGIFNEMADAFSLFGDVPDEMSGVEVAVARLTQTVHFLNGAIQGVVSAFSAVGGVVTLAFAGALTVVRDVAEVLSKVGLASAQTVTEIQTAAERATAAAAGMFDRAEKAVSAGGQSMAKAMKDVEAQTRQTAETAEKGMKKAGDATEDTAKKAAALAAETTRTQATFEMFGIQAETVLGKPTKAIQEMIARLPVLQTALQQMGATGIAESGAIEQAFRTMLNKAKTTEDLAAIRIELNKMGQDGSLSVKKVADIASDLELKLRTVSETTDETTAAFARLGIQSKQALAESARKMMADFETVKNSGQATADELEKAFEKVSRAVLASEDSQTHVWLTAQAAVNGYTTEVDANGRMVVQKANEAIKATRHLGQSYAEAGQMGIEASTERTKALEQEIEQTNRLTEANAQLKSSYADAGSGSIHSAKVSSWMTAYEQIKSKGFTDEEAIRLTEKAKQYNDDAWRQLSPQSKRISSYGSGYGQTGVNKAIEEAIKDKTNSPLRAVSAATAFAVPEMVAQREAGKTVNLNLDLGQTRVQATTTESQSHALETLIKQLEQAKSASGY